MKVTAVLLRWYKSFNVNYMDHPDRAPGVVARPWDGVGPDGMGEPIYRFIEIPIESDITTIVCANESGKSHLISAIMKVIRGEGIPEDGPFSQTDLCHYTSRRSKNADLWPNVGLQLSAEEQEARAAIEAVGQDAQIASGEDEQQELTLILAPDQLDRAAYLFVGRSGTPIPLSEEQLREFRRHLPDIKFIESKLPISDQVPLRSLLRGYGDKKVGKQRIYDFSTTLEVANLVAGLKVPDKADAPMPAGLANSIKNAKAELKNAELSANDEVGLEVLLFRDVLGIEAETLQFLSELRERDRGYMEGLVGTWNKEIDEKLNLSQYWQQDQAFGLRINYKQGVLFFEITDKTGAIYTFRERSSGLRYFLSYYIQAKALGANRSGKGAIVLMDEPDSFLSILGQKNLLAVFESLVSPEVAQGMTQLIYTTHSPFLINRNFPRRIRLVKKGDAEEGTQYIERSRVRRYEPVRSALGVDCAQTLFMGGVNVVLEGPTDQYLIAELVRTFVTPDNASEYLDLNSVVLVSAESASSVEKMIAASRWGDEPIPTFIVLVDDDDAGHEVRDRITGKARHCKELVKEEFVLLVSDVIGKSRDGQAIVTTDDLVPSRLYGRAVERYVARWHPHVIEEHGVDFRKSLEDTGFGSEGVVAATEAVFNRWVFSREQKYDKMGVLESAVDELLSVREDPEWTPVIEELRTRVIALCHALRRSIASGAREERQRSGKQAVQRIVGDFLVNHKESSSVFDIQLVLERLQRESEYIGEDAERLALALNALLSRIRDMRAASQDRVVQKDWEWWRAALEKIRQNPLNPDVRIQASADDSEADDPEAEGGRETDAE